MKITHIIFTLGLMCLLPLQGGPLTLEQALQKALEDNKELKLARADLQLADARVTEAWSSVFPHIATDINYTRNLSDQFIYINGGFGGQTGPTRFSFTFKNEYSLRTQLNQTLYSFGKVGTALDIAYDYEKYVRALFRYQKEQILIKVEEAFYQTWIARQIFQLARESEAAAKENYQRTKIQFESGVRSELALLQAEVRWRSAIPEALAARNGYELALNSLKNMLNIPVNDSLEVQGRLDLPDVLPAKVPLESALQKRPDFQARLLEARMRDKNVDLEFANHLPDLSGQLTYTYSGRSDAFKLENDYDNYVLGVSLHIPLFSGGYTSAQVQKARVDAAKTHIQVARLQDQIATELENVHLSLEESFKQIKSAERAVTAARRAYELANAQSQAGHVTQLELKDARIVWDQARIARLNALFTYQKALLKWRLVTGSYMDTQTQTKMQEHS